MEKRELPLILILMALVGLMAHPAYAGFDHGQWDALLKENIVSYQEGRVTEVNYRAMADQRHRLQGYLKELAAVKEAEFNHWEQDEQLAFLINVYNSWTVETVLEGYPEIESIKDLGSFFSSVWKKKRVELFGRLVSLDEVEHGLIRGSGRYNDPRIHFAVNCASIGCPALRPEAYTGTMLRQQLEDATRLFLSDGNRNRYEKGRLQLSKIFSWYGEDFASGWRQHQSLKDFLRDYGAELGIPEALRADDASEFTIEFLPYDWHLNALR